MITKRHFALLLTSVDLQDSRSFDIEYQIQKSR